MNGRKMSKSDGNTITPEELFTGDSPHISKAYTPMVVRFFGLQSHYSSTLDITDEGLKAADKGFRRLIEGYKTLENLEHPGNGTAGSTDKEINDLIDEAFVSMSDDFNAPMALARLFEIVTKINGLKEGHIAFAEVSAETLQRTKQVFKDFIFDIFGLYDDLAEASNSKLDGVMELVIELRQRARENKDWGTSDVIRDRMKELNIQLKDGKEGTTYTIEN